jgi:hypothetical protein
MKSSIITSLLLVLSFTVFAQVKTDAKKNSMRRDSTPLSTEVVAEMKDGNRIQGKLLERNGDTVVIESVTFGKLNLLISNMKSFKDVKKAEAESKAWYPNRYAHHTGILNTAFSIPKGEGYYSSISILSHHYNYGVSDNFSLGVGGVWLVVAGALHVNAKYTAPLGKNFRIGAGAFAGVGGTFGLFNSNGDGGRAFFGLPYGVATFGTADNNGSLTVMRAVNRDINDEDFTTIIAISGQFRLGKGFQLVTDNFFSPNSPSFVMTIGGRYIGKKVVVGGSYPLVKVDDFVVPSTTPLLFVGVPINKKTKK